MSLPFVYPPFTGELCPVFFSALRVAKSALSISDATVSTPPTIAHVLWESRSVRDKAWAGDDGTYEVRKCAKDCRVSAWTIRSGEIS